MLKRCTNPSLRAAFLVMTVGGFGVPAVSATDYFVTIGGGYNRSGNQASLEANVLFFQHVLIDKHRGSRHHEVFFADGSDPGADLQVLAPKPQSSKLPATELLASLHRRRGQEFVTYRNHQVPDVSGPLEPDLVRGSLEAIARNARPTDTVIIYVTAHGSGGPKEDPFNTTIDCWNERKVSAREFTKWLNKIPAEVPVVMVMAQCYCGGFAHAIFDELDEKKGLSKQVRAGFFAQQHNLPAAGCRPDIEHDEEFSSYFWGAIAGRSRNGAVLESCDADGNGVISFAEAFGYAVTDGETIDIPLRTSEVFLRTYSRLPTPKIEPAVASSEGKPEEADADSVTKTADTTPAKPVDDTNLSTMSGKLQSFVDQARPVSGRIVTKLSKTLGFTLEDDISVLIAAYDEHRKAGRFSGRGGRRRPGSGRRELLKEVTDKWPELGDERHWEESSLLKADNQENLLAELKQLPSWNSFEERRKQMEVAGDQSERHELRAVKFRRLINTLETITLEKNLPLVSAPEIVDRYKQLMSLEESSLGREIPRNAVR